jgi:hypothetical protein
MARFSAQQHRPRHRLLGETPEPENCRCLVLRIARSGVRIPSTRSRVETVTRVIDPGADTPWPSLMPFEVRPLDLMRERATDDWPAVAPSNP